MVARQLKWDELTDSEREFISGIVDVCSYGLKKGPRRYKSQIVNEKLQLVLTKPVKKSKVGK